MKRFKFIFLLLGFLSLAGIGIANAADPVIYYTDLISGHNGGAGTLDTDGKDGNGDFVTLFGKNFGSTPGTVTVGGGTAINVTGLWTDNKVIIQLGHNAITGNIVLTTSGGIPSNAIPFVVRTGRIYFVDPNVAVTGTGTYLSPFKSPKSFVDLPMKAADTLYFRAGTYTGAYGPNTWANFAWDGYTPDGTDGNHIAFVGYPGERPKLEAWVTGRHSNIGFNYRHFYHVWSNFWMRGYNGCVGHTGRYNRFVDCKFEGGTDDYFHCQLQSGYYDNYGYLKILGCDFTGATSHQKQDHSIYIDYGSDFVEVGWCNFYNNDYAVGPVIQIHTDTAIRDNFKFEGNSIHDCLFDDRYSIIDTGDPTDTGWQWQRPFAQNITMPGSYTYFYNNTMIGTYDPAGNPYAVGTNTGLFINSGSIDFYNNVFFNIGESHGTDTGLVDGNSLDWTNDLLAINEGNVTTYGVTYITHPERVNIKNNIFYNTDTSFSNHITIDPNTVAYSTISITNNCFYGNGSTPPAISLNSIGGDPLFISTNTASFDFHLKPGSICIGTGVSVPASVVLDGEGITRSATPNMGIYETVPGAIAAYDISGYVNTSSSVGISGVSVALTGTSNRIYTTAADGYYSFNNLDNGGSYTITPTKTYYSFSPVSISTNSLGGDLTEKNFTGTVELYDISGYISEDIGSTMNGVSVSLTGSVSKSTTTSVTGFYQFLDIPKGSNCTVLPVKTDYTFTPSNKVYSTLSADQLNQNYQGHYTTGGSGVLNPGQVRVKVSGVVVTAINMGVSADIEFLGYSTGTYRCAIFGPDGYIKQQSTLYDVSSGSFTWTTMDTEGKYIPVIKGPGMYQWKAVDVVQ